jgi:type IV pilus assembly protein PilQ
MREEEARRKFDSLKSEVELLDKAHEDLLKERREIARQYRVTPDPEVFRKPVTMDFQGITLKNALRLLGEQAGINIIVGDDVKGTTTLRLIQVPLGQVIDDLLRTNNLDRDLIGNVMWVGEKKRIEDSKKQRRDEQARIRDDVEKRIKQNRDSKRDIERQREKAVETLAQQERAVDEAAEEAPGAETVGQTETIEIEGEPVTLLLVQIKLNYAKPGDVRTILDCVFNRKCAGIQTTPEQQREEERTARSEQLQGEGFLPGSPGYDDRMRQVRQEQREERRTSVDRGIRARIPESGAPGFDMMDPRFKKLLAHTMIWPSDKEMLLFLRDTPERIEEMKRLIATLDVPTPQILIESRLVQAETGPGAWASVGEARTTRAMLSGLIARPSGVLPANRE